MATTKVVNKRRGKKKTKKRRRRNYGAAARTSNKRRSKRRRNPTSVRRSYSSGGYRQTNPSGLPSMDEAMDIVPAGTGGIWAARWGVKMAGEFEDGEPGWKHAFAIWIAAGLGGDMIGNVLGSSQKGLYARIAALSWGGDLFARKVFMKESDWVEKNLYLGDESFYDDDTYDYSDDEDLDGFQDTSQLGAETFTDAVGNTYIRTARGWALAGANMGQPQTLDQSKLMVGPDGTLYQLQGNVGAYQYPADYENIMEQGMGVPSDPANRLGGFQNRSVLGMAPMRSGDSSFGYSR